MRAYAVGTFEATGADIYVCCGFRPDVVYLHNQSDGTNLEWVRWNANMRAATNSAGISLNKASTMTQTVLTRAVGITVYLGKDVVSAASASYVMPNPSPDQRGNGTGSYITKWTKDAATTGHFDYGVTVTGNRAVKAGGRFNVNGVWYTIDAITNDGDASTEITVTEDASPASGPVYSVLSTFDFIPIDATLIALVGSPIITKPGFRVDSAMGAVSTDGDVVAFEAWCYN